uniref:Uncharacterized protein n=1 Tax=Amphimedon queenslandica TaxID=400682 RepID=A0A1X7TBF3_AMPQE
APRSIDDCFQESGRGGRTGCKVESVVYWTPIDCPRTKDPKTVLHGNERSIETAPWLTPINSVGVSKEWSQKMSLFTEVESILTQVRSEIIHGIGQNRDFYIT